MKLTDGNSCAQHGEMEMQPAGTPEQAYCGIWYRCTRCANTALIPSAAIAGLMLSTRSAA